MHARVPQVMAQFVLKIELLSHHGTTPILEMARAYGLRPRLWLLLMHYVQLTAYVFMDVHYTVGTHLYINFSNHAAKVELIILLLLLLLLLLLFRMAM